MKPIRLCTVCGARVTNINQKTTTCDRFCQLAKDHNISRQRAQMMEEAPIRMVSHGLRKLSHSHYKQGPHEH